MSSEMPPTTMRRWRSRWMLPVVLVLCLQYVDSEKYLRAKGTRRTKHKRNNTNKLSPSDLPNSTSSSSSDRHTRRNAISIYDEADLVQQSDEERAAAEAYLRLSELGVIKAPKHSLKVSHALSSARTRFGRAYLRMSKAVRELKGTFSSDFERACLKATRPDDDPAKEKHVQALIASVAEYPDVQSRNFDPYYVMLHKLWSRMSERDWRTVAKSLYILHRLWQSITVEDTRQLRTRLASLIHQHSKKSGSRYFSVRRLAMVGAQGERFKPFLHSYASYVLERVRMFSAHFDELLIAKQGTELWAHLKRAQRVLNRVLVVELTADTATDVTAPCMELIAKDVGQLVAAFSSRLRQRIDNYSDADDDCEDYNAELEACTFYCEAVPRLEEWVLRNGRLCRRLGVRLSEQVLEGLVLLPVSTVTVHMERLRERTTS